MEDILVETTGKAPTAKPQATFSRSGEYWIGWAIAYYQWFSGRKFGDIFKVLSFEDLQQMYAPLHEADISKFADIADSRIRAYFTDTNLKRIRTTYGCTQAELAKRSGVSLRSIQMYEQHNKDINKASAETVLSLAKSLAAQWRIFWKVIFVMGLFFVYSGSIFELLPRRNHLHNPLPRVTMQTP